MRKKNTKKLTACLLALALALTTAGCAGSKEQEAAAETPEMEEMEANASDTVGGGTDMNMDLDTEETETSVPLKEALTINVSHMETQPGRNKLYVDIENTTENDITIEWLDFIIDGQTASEDSGSEFWNWFPDHWSHKIKAGDIYQETFFIEHPIEYTEYVEAVIEATASDSRQTESLNITISLKDTETIDTSDSLTSPTLNLLFVEKQELYNENGIIITLPEQKVGFSDDMHLELHVESGFNSDVNVSFLNVTVNGELISEGSHTNGDTYFHPGESDISLYLGNCIGPDKNPGEITFVLDLWDDRMESIDNPEITIPYAVIAE